MAACWGVRLSSRRSRASAMTCSFAGGNWAAQRGTNAEREALGKLRGHRVSDHPGGRELPASEREIVSRRERLQERRLSQRDGPVFIGVQESAF